MNAQVFKDYFGELEEESIRDNFGTCLNITPIHSEPHVMQSQAPFYITNCSGSL